MAGDRLMSSEQETPRLGRERAEGDDAKAIARPIPGVPSLGDEHITRAADFGDEDGPYVPTNEEICQKLIDYCLCEAGLDYVGSDPVEGSDHGHTACFFLGWAIKRLRAGAMGDVTSCKTEHGRLIGDRCPECGITFREWNRAAGDVTPPPDAREWLADFVATTFAFGDPDDPLGVTVQYRDAGKWAVTRLGRCLNREGEWEYEPSPSNRDDEFIARCRFSLLDALAAARGLVLPEPPQDQP